MELKEIIKEVKEIEDIKIIYQEKSYCLLGVNDKFYYLEDSINNLLYHDSTLTITLYNKVDYNHKIQVGYPKSMYNSSDVISYINSTKKEVKKPLKDCYKQVIFYDLLGYKERKNGTPYTLIKELKDNSGYREKDILKNIDWIIEEQKDNNYHILKFIDKDGNYFKINTKNRNSLIVG